MLGFLLLTFLTVYAFVAALLATTRLRYGSRAETLLTACLLWNFIILLPIHALGVAGVLYRSTLGWSSFLISSAVIGASFARVDSWEGFLREGWQTAHDVARLPFEALTISFQRRSLVFVGLVAVLSVLSWTAWMAYLAPSDAWDGIWYHETMIGYAIQNHGYATMHLPMNLTQQANGYPRNCEMTGLWFVIFTDRRLVELPNSLMAVATADSHCSGLVTSRCT